MSKQHHAARIQIQRPDPGQHFDNLCSVWYPYMQLLAEKPRGFPQPEAVAGADERPQH